MSEKDIEISERYNVGFKYDNYNEAKRTAETSLIADPPTQITFETTRVCNLRCNYCYPLRLQLTNIKDFDIKSDYIYYMDYEISQAKSLVFSGFGEPLLNKNIFDYAKFMRKHNNTAAIIYQQMGL